MAPILLLADDNSTIQRLVELTFANHGIDVISVLDGQEAIDYLSARRPDIALVSVSLSRRDGYDVARFVQREPSLRGLPVLLVAGAFDTVDEAQVRESGAVGVLFKPFESTQVINRVKELLGLSARQAEAPEDERVAPVQAGRLLTSAAGPPHRESPAATVEGPSLRAIDEEDTPLDAVPARNQPALTAPARDVAAAEAVDASAENYFGHLDEAFDSLDAQLASHFAPSERATEVATPSRYATAFEPGGRRPSIAPPASSGAPSSDPTAAFHAPAAPPTSILHVGPSLTGVGGNPVFEVEDEWFPRSGAREASAGPAPGQSPAMADAFALILAQEQGERIPEPEESPVHQLYPPASIELSDDTIDRIAQRVADRLIAGPLGERVTRAANDVSERLVREEIARIRAAASPTNT